MKEQSVSPGKDFRYSELYLDFLAKKPAMKKYFIADEPFEVAVRLGRAHIDRELIANVLVRQNTAYGAKPETFKVIEKLRKEDTLCIFGGQQAGLFGGPLFTLYKAIGLVKHAQLLQKKLHREVVPIFWIASDDHDFDEINHAFVLNQKGEIERLSYETPPASAVAAAEILFADADQYNHLARRVEVILGETDFTGELYRRLFAAYREGNSFVNAFGQYLLDILPDIGLVMFSPADKEVKVASRPFFKKLAEGHFRFREILDETNRNLESDGYHIQAEKKESAVNLFIHTPARVPVHYEDDSFVFGDKKLGLTGLIDLIDRHPERFSPDVLARPLWQSYLFPVVAQTGGPSEIAYFAQIGQLFDVFGLVQPYHYARPSLSIIEKRPEELIAKLELRFSDFVGDPEQLVNRVTERSFPKEMEAAIADFKSKFEDAFNGFFAAVRKFDESLEPMGKQTYGKIDFAVNAYEKKIYDHHKRRMISTRNQIYRLGNVLFPYRNLQERTLNINCYIAKYGFALIDFLVKEVSVSSIEHQLLYISEMTAKK
jgi:bacillithiol biosynthesis cysteine-adding enzyme BshC